jgi:hypothetical protein
MMINKEVLLETAGELKQVGLQAAEEYLQKADRLVDLMNTQMQAREDIDNLVGPKNIAMMKDNHANHVRFIGSILKNKNTIVLVETVLWVFRAYRSHGFQTNYWAAQLNAWIGILKQELSPEAFLEIYPYYAWMQVNIPIFVIVSDEELNANNSMH